MNQNAIITLGSSFLQILHCGLLFTAERESLPVSYSFRPVNSIQQVWHVLDSFNGTIQSLEFLETCLLSCSTCLLEWGSPWDSDGLHPVGPENMTVCPRPLMKVIEGLFRRHEFVSASVQLPCSSLILYCFSFFIVVCLWTAQKHWELGLYTFN